MPFSGNTFTILNEIGTGYACNNALVPLLSTDLDDIATGLTTVQTEISALPNTTIPSVNWYVSATGNDSNTGQSVGSPFLTIQHAINVILGYSFGGQLITLNVGAGSFATFIMTGLGQGSSGSGSLNTLGIVLVGAGSGSTSIAAGITLRGARLNLSACTVDCAAGTNGIAGDGYTTLVLNGDVTFSGNSNSATAIVFNQFSSVIQDDNVTLSGIIGTYFQGFAFANYEQNAGNLTVAGGATISTLLLLDTLSNYHFFGGNVVVSGTTTSNVYILSAQSAVACYGGLTLDTIWTGGGGLTGVLETGSRSEGAVTAPSVISSGGTVALATGSNANSAVATLTVTGGSPTSGTVSITVNEFLCYSPGVASTYVAGLQNGTGSWAAGATAIISSISSTSGSRTYVIAWSNNGVGLINDTYIINLIGQT